MERDELEKQYGQVWDTKQLQEDFEVLSFMAPLVIVKVKLIGQRASLEFQHILGYYH